MTGARAVAAVGFVPSTPLLVPELGGAAPGEPDAIRSAARRVLEAILACRPDRIVVVASCEAPTLNGAEPTWDFSGFGLPRPVVPGSRPLPWQLGLGAWLLDDRGWGGQRQFLGALSAESAAPGTAGGRTAYLAVGDGSVYLPDQRPDGAERGARGVRRRGQPRRLRG